MQFPTHVAVNGLSGVPLVLDALRENWVSKETVSVLRRETDSAHLLVSELKCCISQTCHVPRACQQLICGTELMDDWRPIAAYGNGTEILHINLVASLNDLFGKMAMGDGEESGDALQDLENAVLAFKSNPAVQEDVCRTFSSF